MPTNLSPATSNRILARISAKDFALLAPDLKRVDLPLRKQLETRNKAIEFVYFPESGFASVVANGSGHSIEVGLIGREGMTGLAVVMVSSELPEILGLCDRILVLHNGKITGEFTRDEATAEAVMSCATGQKACA